MSTKELHIAVRRGEKTVLHNRGCPGKQKQFTLGVRLRAPSRYFFIYPHHESAIYIPNNKTPRVTVIPFILPLTSWSSCLQQLICPRSRFLLKMICLFVLGVRFARWTWCIATGFFVMWAGYPKYDPEILKVWFPYTFIDVTPSKACLVYHDLIVSLRLRFYFYSLQCGEKYNIRRNKKVEEVERNIPVFLSLISAVDYLITLRFRFGEKKY